MYHISEFVATRISLIAVRTAPDVATGAYHERTGSWLMKAIVPVLPAVKVGIPEGRKEALIPGRSLGASAPRPRKADFG